MKPLRLAMQAFGPFPGTEVIDFAALQGRTLLLIHGPTGSGKTTLLDAMCFALFGETSGKERSAEEMRSSLARAEDLTEVTYDFSLGDRVWRVRRSPLQDRPYVRRSGTTEHKHTATLWDRTGVLTTDDGNHVATGASPVSAKITELFGFSAAQFRQVVMLPQGKFQIFLKAETKEKEALLKQLFGTGLYERITTALHDRALRLSREFSSKGHERTILLNQAEVATQADLELQISRFAEQVELRKAAEREAIQEQAKRVELLNAAQEVQRRLKSLEDAQSALQLVDSGSEKISAIRDRLEPAQRAQDLISSRDHAAQRALEATTAAAACEKAMVERDNALAVLATCERARADEHARLPEHDAAQRDVADLDRLEPRIKQLTDAGEALRDLSKQLEQAELNVRESAIAAVAAEQSLQTWTDGLQRTQELAAQEETLRLKSQSAKEQIKKFEDLGNARNGLAKATAAVEAARAESVEANDALAAVRAAEAELHEGWRRGQASVLARDLTEGAPCPVCGGTEHPNAAVANADVPSQQALDEARAALDTADRLSRKCEKTLSDCTGDCRLRGEAVERMSADLGATGLSPDELRVRWATLDLELQEACKAAARVDAEKAIVHSAQENSKRCTDSAAAAKATSVEVRMQHAAAATLHETYAAEVPESLRADGALAKALTVARDKAEALKAALKAADDKFDAANSESVRAAASAEASVKGTATAQQHDKDARAKLVAEREAAQLSDNDAFDRACSDVDKIAEFQSEIAAFDTSLTLARGRCEQAALDAQGLVPVDVEALSSAAAAATAAAAFSTNERSTIEHTLDARIKLLSQCRDVSAAVAQLEAQHRTVGRVADVALGKGVNAANLSFQAFVLAVLLDDVLLQASERLSRMSGDRYRLVRRDEVGHKSVASGLEIDVTDAYSGSRRAVATLSGGESFLAALALCLGLADVVQAYAGGTQLETLFIDEGFGSLDTEALDAALATLVKLHEGHRLVAIISHVSELRERVDTQLEIRKTDRGSSAHLRLG
jgi:exonuclease SbcC